MRAPPFGTKNGSATADDILCRQRIIYCCASSFVSCSLHSHCGSRLRRGDRCARGPSHRNDEVVPPPSSELGGRAVEIGAMQTCNEIRWLSRCQREGAVDRTKSSDEEREKKNGEIENHISHGVSLSFLRHLCQVGNTEPEDRNALLEERQANP